MLKDQVKDLPRLPGVYIMKDEQGEILYIGKAIDLKRRVSSYFQNSKNMLPKIKQMVYQIHSFTTIVVDTELEALITECGLIKRHRPPYNALLKNERWYPYIKIEPGDFPRLVSTTVLQRDDAQYYGPYRGSYEVEETIGLIQRLFKIRSCGKAIQAGGPSATPCFNYHIGRCQGPCCKGIDVTAYQMLVDEAVHFIKAGEGNIVKKLKSEMKAAAMAQNYERAARIRDEIANLEHFMHKQRAIHSALRNEDTIAFAKSHVKNALQVYFIRYGLLVGQTCLSLEPPLGNHLAVLEGFLEGFYPESNDVKKENVLQKEIDEIIIIQGWLARNASKNGASVIRVKKNTSSPLSSAVKKCKKLLEVYDDEIHK